VFIDPNKITQHASQYAPERHVEKNRHFGTQSKSVDQPGVKPHAAKPLDRFSIVPFQKLQCPNSWLR
jgi:hypothetical protein